MRASRFPKTIESGILVLWFLRKICERNRHLRCSEMLNRVEINEFRSCRDVVLDNLGPMTVLVGRNASGKTNILEAIRWLANSTTRSSSEGVDEDGRVSLTITTDGFVFDLQCSVTRKYDRSRPPEDRVSTLREESLNYRRPGGTAQQLFLRKDETVTVQGLPEALRIGATASCLSAIASLMPRDSRQLRVIRPLLRALRSVRYYGMDEDVRHDATSIVEASDYSKWLARYMASGEPGQSILLRLLHLFLTDEGRFDEICSILGPNGLQLVDRIIVRPITEAGVGEKGDDGAGLYYITFRPSVRGRGGPGGPRLDFRQLSSGTQRLIRIVLALLFDRPTIMLLEHPEDEIHRALLDKLIDMLRGYSDQTQIIIASHSSVVFNTLDPNMVRLVAIENGITQARALTREELQTAKRFLEEDGSLADFLRDR